MAAAIYTIDGTVVSAITNFRATSYTPPGQHVQTVPGTGTMTPTHVMQVGRTPWFSRLRFYVGSAAALTNFAIYEANWDIFGIETSTGNFSGASANFLEWFTSAQIATASTTPNSILRQVVNFTNPPPAGSSFELCLDLSGVYWVMVMASAAAASGTTPAAPTTLDISTCTGTFA